MNKPSKTPGKKYKVSARVTLILDLETHADSTENAINLADQKLGEFAEFAQSKSDNITIAVDKVNCITGRLFSVATSVNNARESSP